MTPRRRWAVISLAAIAAAIAAWLVPQDKDLVQVVTPGERARAAAASASTSTVASRPQAEPLSTQLPVRAPLGRQRGDPFAARSWTPPPQAQPQQAEAPRPPPNPYRFAGTLQQDGVRKVFLLLGERVVEAKEGEMLEQGFRVKSVTTEAVTLIHDQIPDPVTIKLAFGEQPAPAASAARGATIDIPPLSPNPPR